MQPHKINPRHSLWRFTILRIMNRMAAVDLSEFIDWKLAVSPEVGEFHSTCLRTESCSDKRYERLQDIKPCELTMRSH